MQAFSIEQIAAYLQERFTVQCMGDHALMITHIAPLDRAGANEISFFSDAKRRQQLESSEAGALLINAAEYAQ